MNNKITILICCFLGCLTACNKPEQMTLFELVDSAKSGFTFINELKFDRNFNIYKYRNFYNGGGVGIGDFNKDGFQDVYMTANMGPNKLYINRGDFKFKEVSAAAGVEGERAWSTGVSVVDINGDGWLDIYVCNSGDVKGDNKQNELFINNQDGSFTEKAADYGLADQGYSTHAAFFDYDRDGDLDVYLLNNSYQAIGGFNLRKNERPNRDPEGGDKLFRNDGESFTDVSEEAGIYGSVIGFGLGVTVGDVNRDGWLDMYISNDFFERDYLYINNGDGTFSEDLENQFNSISAASMGADMADVNNDGYPEIFVTEMLPSDELRIKTKTTFEDWDRYQYGLENGYYHQFTRNMFHLNNGNNSFSEVGRMANVHATDWSWGALIADFNNDGHKDIYVANGINQDLTDQDFLNFIANEETMKAIISDEGVDYEKLIEAIPSNKIRNHMMVNTADATGILFEDKAVEWGLGQPSFSNGSAYVDLDNDGDLDLVVNNVNMEAFVYKNNSRETAAENANYIQISLSGTENNPYALGSNVIVFAGEAQFYVENIPMRGFQSTVDNKLHFGLGSISKIDSIQINWYNGQQSTLFQQDANQLIKINSKEIALEEQSFHPVANTLGIIELNPTEILDYQHKENEFVDFDRDRLIFHMLSSEGPCICKADINNDGLEDMYLGGAKDQPGNLLIQTNRQSFKTVIPTQFESDKISEDIDCQFFDADGDGDLDLYVSSGGNEFPSSSSALADRLYFNDGGMNFSRSQQILPAGKYESSSCLKTADFDSDGDLDMLIGLRLKPFLFGIPVGAYVLENDGKGSFKRVSSETNNALSELGMIKDLEWIDIDGDGVLEIIIVGEWMPISIFKKTEQGYSNITGDLGLEHTNGWWNAIESADLDADGDIDFVIGNHGLNSRFKASADKPIELYINDFDQNGQAEQIMCMYNGDKSFPIALKHDLEKQMPGLRKQFLKYTDYAGKTIQDIFSVEVLEKSVKQSVYELSSSVLINNGNEKWDLIPLEIKAQTSPVYAIEIVDINSDDNLDLILGGNLYNVKPEMGRYDASFGHILLGDGQNTFSQYDVKNTEFKLSGEIRHLEMINVGGEAVLIAVRNNDTPQFFKINVEL